jgi:hypothetical protein
MNAGSLFQWEWLIIELLLLAFAIFEVVSYRRYKRRMQKQVAGQAAATDEPPSPPAAGSAER